MSLMDVLDQFILGPLNLIDHFEGLLKGVVFHDMGYKIAILRYDKGGRFRLKEVEAILQQYGVTIYGRTYDANRRYFLVKERQARWAEYLLLHAGVEILSPLYDERNRSYVARHPSGWMPTPWSEEE